MVRSYRDLVAWQKALDLVEAVYEASRSFPREEQFGLTSQLRRAAVSVPSNIAEGQGRGTKELETQIVIARRLGYISVEVESAVLRLSDETGRLISGLARSVRDQSAQ